MAISVDFDPLGDLVMGPAEDLGEQRELGFKMIKSRMIEEYNKKIKHTAPMVRSAKISAYAEALEDAFRVFTRIVESQGGENFSAT